MWLIEDLETGRLSWVIQWTQNNSKCPNKREAGWVVREGCMIMGTEVKVMWTEAKEYGRPLEARKM